LTDSQEISLLIVLCTIVTVCNGIAPPDLIDDKLYGGILLGQYGDALGAPTEDAEMKYDNPVVPLANQSAHLVVASTWWGYDLWPNIWENMVRS